MLNPLQMRPLNGAVLESAKCNCKFTAEMRSRPVCGLTGNDIWPENRGTDAWTGIHYDADAPMMDHVSQTGKSSHIPSARESRCRGSC